MHIKLSEIRDDLSGTRLFSLQTRGTVRLDLDPEPILNTFGFGPGDRINTPSGKATVIGVFYYQLYFLPDTNQGVVSSPRASNRQDLIREGFSLLDVDDKDYDFIHPAIQRVFKQEFREVHKKRSLEKKLGHFGHTLGTKILELLSVESEELHQKFNKLETKFANTRDLTLKDIRKYEKKYAKLSKNEFVDNNKFLYYYIVLRSLQLTTLRKGIEGPTLQTIVTKKNQILIDLATSGHFGIRFLKELAKDTDITFETRLDIANILWSKIADFVPEVRVYILNHFLLPIGYSEQSPEDFANRVKALCPSDVKSIMNNYLNNALENGYKLASTSTNTKLGWTEAVKWYSYAIKHPKLIKATDFKKLEDSVLHPYFLPPNQRKLQNEIRLWLCAKYLTSNHPHLGKVFLSIDTSLLEDHQQQNYTRIKKQYYFKRLQAIYQAAQDLDESHWQITGDEIIEARQFQKRLNAILVQYANPTENQSLEEYEEMLHNIGIGLTQLLAERWEDIRKTQLIYTHNTTSIVNQACLKLAESLDPNHKYQLLMPTLIQGAKENEEDLYGPILDGYDNNLNDLNFGQFILTEDQTHFIDIKNITQTVIDNTEAGTKPKVIHRLGGTYEELELTDKEQASLTSLLPTFYSNILPLANQRYQATQLTALGAFQQLRLGLQRGDYQHGNSQEENRRRDEDAGADAIIATAQFVDWFTRLPIETQEELKQMEGDGRKFDYVYKQLTSQQSNRLDTRLCVNLLGGTLQQIINRNTNRLKEIGKGRGSIEEESRWQEAIQSLTIRINDASNIDASELEEYQNPVEQSFEELKNIYKFISIERQRLVTNPSGYLFNLVPASRHPLLIEYDPLLTQMSTLWAQRSQLTESDIKDIKTGFALALHCDSKADHATRQNYYDQFPGTQPHPKAISLLKNLKKNASEKANIDAELLRAPVGTTAYCLDAGTINLYAKTPTRGIIKTAIHFDLENQTTPFYIMENKVKIAFNTLQQATDDFNVKSILGSDYPQVYNEFVILNSVIRQAPTEELKQNLLTLKTELLKEAFTQLHAGKPQIDIIQGNVGNVIRQVQSMMTQINSNQDQQAKLTAIKHCHDTLVPSQTAKNIGKAVLALCITAICTVIGGTLGAGLGLVTGPGAAVTGIAGVTAGAAIGGGAAAAVTGITVGSLCSFGFFRRNTQEKTLDKTLDLATKQVRAPS